jgi:integrase
MGEDRRAPGEGNVEPLRSGRFRVRMRVPGRTTRNLPGTYATREEAEAVRVATLAQLAEAGRAAVGGLTLRAFGGLVLERWQARGHRTVDDDRNMFKVHLATAHFADWPIQNVRRVDGKRWRDELMTKTAVRTIMRGPRGARVFETTPTPRLLARQRIVNIMSLARRIFTEACEDELVEHNPFDGIRIPPRPRTDKPWTYLELEEQHAFLAAVPERERPLIGFMIGSGMREGEVYALKTEDVHVEVEHPFVHVRFGGRESAPKNGRSRNVQLFGLALTAAKKQLELHLHMRNKHGLHGLMFPGVRGSWRAEGKAPKGWREWKLAAGISRRVRVHDLRHTCGSALVSGMWGRAWSIEEVCDHLGHSDIRVTQRYAHLAGSAAKRAAKDTIGPHVDTNALFV